MINKQPLTIEIPEGIPIYDIRICKCCNQEFEVREEDKYTAKFFRCQNCNKNLLFYSLIYSCNIS